MYYSRIIHTFNINTSEILTINILHPRLPPKPRETSTSSRCHKSENVSIRWKIKSFRSQKITSATRTREQRVHYGPASFNYLKLASVASKDAIIATSTATKSRSGRRRKAASSIRAWKCSISILAQSSDGDIIIHFPAGRARRAPYRIIISVLLMAARTEITDYL